MSEPQRNSVASNDVSIIEAYIAIIVNGYSFSFGLYDGEKPVGFVETSEMDGEEVIAILEL